MKKKNRGGMAVRDAADILVVDDTPANLQLLAEMLKAEGHKVRPVTSGAVALQAALSRPPDLTLLDISMPGMDGYEVCGYLKADAVLKEVPVLFISALGETEDKVKAFNCGGVDYITKPFRCEEVMARVKTQLQIRRQKRSLQESYDRLRELESLRDSLVHMVVHDMNSPIAVLGIGLSMLEKEAGSGLNEAHRKLLDVSVKSTKKLAEMVSQLLAVSRMEAGEMPLEKSVCELDQIVRNAVQPRVMVCEDNTISVEAPPGLKTLCDAKIIQRVVGNLVDNAIKFSPAKSEVRVAVLPGRTELQVTVSDNGPGIPEGYRRKIFDKFCQVDSKKNKNFGTGLGLAFCRLAVEAHGGRIGVECGSGSGSTFWFTLPVEQSTA